MGGCCLGRHFEASRSDRRQSALAKSALAKGAWCSSKAFSMPKGATGPLWANFWPGLTGTLGYFKTPRPGLGWIMCSICLLEPPPKNGPKYPENGVIYHSHNGFLRRSWNCWGKVQVGQPPPPPLDVISVIRQRSCMASKAAGQLLDQPPSAN